MLDFAITNRLPFYLGDKFGGVFDRRCNMPHMNVVEAIFGRKHVPSASSTACRTLDVPRQLDCSKINTRGRCAWIFVHHHRADVGKCHCSLS